MCNAFIVIRCGCVRARAREIAMEIDGEEQGKEPHTLSEFVCL